MDKKEEKVEESEEAPVEVVEEVKAVSLAEVPTQYGLVYRTPDGDMSQDQYLVWLGNMFLDFRAAIVGK